MSDEEAPQQQDGSGPRLELRTSPTHRFVGTSAAAQAARAFARRVASTDHTVLLLGETGAGKDQLAEYIHGLGRSGKPLIVVDCGAMPEALIEAELFGSTRGAYTDATEGRPGLVTEAEGGTLFVNEVGNMGPRLQARFLRLLERKPYRQLGGRRDIEVRARFIAATNVNLAAEVSAGHFRLDLLHRLNVLPFVLPPLRTRTEDIPALVATFAQSEDQRFTPEAIAVLKEYAWPGNVRELQNVVERVLILNDGVIGPNEVHAALTDASATVTALVEPIGTGPESPFPTLSDALRAYHTALHARSSGGVSDAARLSGLARQTVASAWRRFGLTPSRILKLRQGERL